LSTNNHAWAETTINVVEYEQPRLEKQQRTDTALVHEAVFALDSFEFNHPRGTFLAYAHIL